MKHLLKCIILFVVMFSKMELCAQIPGPALAYMQKAIQVMYRNQADSALDYISEAQKIYPGYPGFYYHRSMFYIMKNEPGIALSEINNAIKNWDPSFRGPYDYQRLEYYYDRRGSIYLNNNIDIDLALQDFLKAISLGIDFYGAYSNCGHIYSRKGNYEMAIKYFTQAIKIDPSIGYSYHFRATSYYAMKQYDLALADFTKEISMTPEENNGYLDRAALYEETGQFSLALADFNKSVSINPEHPRPYNDRAFYHGRRGEYDLAIRDFNTAISNDPKYASSYRGRGSIYFVTGEYEKAIADLNKALLFSKPYPFATLNMVLCLARQERFRDAADQYNQYLQLNSKEHLKFPGWNYLQYYFKAVCSWLPQNNYEQALVEIQQAEKNYADQPAKKNAYEVSGFASVIALKGYVLEKLNRNADARDAYKQALVINTNQPDVIRALSAVEKKLADIAQEDRMPPIIELISPQTTRSFGIESDNPKTQIIGKARDISGIASIKINGKLIDKVEEDGLFISDLVLESGANTINITAIDKKGNTATKTFTINGTAVVKKNVKEPDIPVFTDQPPKYFAILIAEKDYQDPGMPDLQNPVKDARELKAILQSTYTFLPANIDTLYNRSKEDIMERIVYRCNTLTDNDNLVIFYAGHGWAEKDQFGNTDGYLVPIDAKKKIISSYISASDLNICLKKSKAKHILMIADACFSGALTRNIGDDAGKDIQKQYMVPSRKVMASGNMEVVPDNSIFIHYLKKNLKANTEKYLTANDLFASFRKAVSTNSDTLPQYAAIKGVGDEGGEFVFIKK